QCNQDHGNRTGMQDHGFPKCELLCCDAKRGRTPAIDQNRDQSEPPQVKMGGVITSPVWQTVLRLVGYGPKSVFGQVLHPLNPSSCFPTVVMTEEMTQLMFVACGGIGVQRWSGSALCRKRLHPPQVGKLHDRDQCETHTDQDRGP